MRYFSLLAFLFVTSACHADLVYNNALSSGTATISNNNSRGQTFTTGSSAAQMVSVTVYLKNTGGAEGTVKIDIKNITGTPGTNAVPVSGSGSVDATSATINAGDISNTSVTAYTFNNFTGSNVTLAADTSYGFTVNMSGITKGSLTLYYGSPITEQNSYSVSNSTFTADIGMDLAGQVDVTAVPEPGTFVLSGFALAAGAICVWIKRRRHGEAGFAMNA